MKMFIKIGPFISKATDDCNMQSSKHYIPGLIRMKFRDPIWRREEKKAGFDQSRLADECIQLKVANGKAWEINESEFLQLEKGKMRFMMWRHRAESCSITRFTINLNKEETAPPVAATLY